MEKDYKYWESFFQSIQMKYYSLLAAPLFFFAIIFLRVENGNSKLLELDTNLEESIVIVSSVLALLAMLLSFMYLRSRFKNVNKELTISDKMDIYKKVVLQKYALLSIVQVLVVLAYGITFHNALMGIFTALLLFSSFFRPEIASARRSLRLSKEEFNEIDYKNNQ